MSNSRRQFLNRASAALMAATAACRKPTPDSANSSALPPGAPPAFGTAPDVGPPVSPSTFAEAEKLVQFQLSAADRQTAAGNWRKTWAVSVPGGWIVYCQAMSSVNGDSALCSTYVPDPAHTWFSNVGGAANPVNDTEEPT